MSAASKKPLPRLAPRIALRRLRTADAEHFHAYRSDPEVGKYQGWSLMSLAEARVFIEGMSDAAFCPANEWFQFAIAERSTDRLIGDVGVCVCTGEDGYGHAEIGFSLDSRWQGKGLGYEAVTETLDLLFEHTAALRIIAVADSRNLPCVRLLERIGMVKTEVKTAVFRGEPCTEYVFTLVRPHALN